MGSIDIDLERYKIMHDHFKEIEKQYQTWMNYYSLFNGALLVAYYSIFQLIGNACNSDIHWKFLVLIAVLGCVASYCWYLSAIGHCRWIGRWRESLMKEENYPKLDFSKVKICSCCNKAAHYHSTFKVTIGFIICVLSAWVAVAYCSMFDCKFTASFDKLFILIIVIGLIALEFFIHIITGSDLSYYSKPQDKKEIACIIYEGISKNIGWTIFFLLFVSALIYAIFNCPTTEIEKKKELINNEESEILFKIEVINSDSLVFNDSVTTTVKHKL